MPTEQEQIVALTKERDDTKKELKTANDALGLATQEIEKLKNANPKDGVDISQKNLRLDLDNVTKERDNFKTKSEALTQQLLKMSQDLDMANRAKIIGDLKALGCTLNDKELSSMSTEELDSLRDASRLFKGNQPSAGLKAFGDTSDAEDPRGKITTPDHFLSSLKKGGN